jgi:transcriptional regulator with XRE-family HTH domain
MSRERNIERIRRAYERSGLSYVALARLTGLKYNSIACWVTGKRNPSDIVTNLVEEKVDVFLNGGAEYINKDLQRDGFMRRVYEICESCPANRIPTEIMKAYDEIPTTSIKNERQR